MDVFQRYVFPYIHSNMYLRIEQDEALIVDPQSSAEAMQKLEAAGVKRLLILLTHEHFDHVSGVNFFREKILNTTVIAHVYCAERVKTAKNNRPLALLLMAEDEERDAIMRFYETIRVEEIRVDVSIREETSLSWLTHTMRLVPCPGHSPGSMVICFDQTHVFSGDYLIPDTEVILRYPGGSARDYAAVTKPFLLALPRGVQILPGHKEPYFLDEGD